MLIEVVADAWMAPTANTSREAAMKRVMSQNSCGGGTLVPWYPGSGKKSPMGGATISTPANFLSRRERFRPQPIFTTLPKRI